MTFRFRAPFGALHTLLAAALLAGGLSAAQGQDRNEDREARRERRARQEERSRELIKKNELELIIQGPVTPEMAPVAAEFTKLFYEDYPELIKRFEHPDNPAPRSIVILFDPNLDIPAHCGGNRVTVSVKWLREHPEDTALLTHELTHAVQRYPRGAPGWLTEGIADYTRKVIGPAEQKGWSLPKRIRPGQSWKEGYRVTARFLLWVDEKHPGTVDKLNRLLQEGKYKDEAFKEITGKELETLWKECVLELSGAS